MVGRLAASFQRIRKKRREAADFTKFAALIDTPETAAFALPAAAHLGVRPVGSTSTAGDAQLDVTGASDRELVFPDLEDGQVHRLGWFERGVTVEITGTASANVYELLLLDFERKPTVIAEFTIP